MNSNGRLHGVLAPSVGGWLLSTGAFWVVIGALLQRRAGQSQYPQHPSVLTHSLVLGGISPENFPRGDYWENTRQRRSARVYFFPPKFLIDKLSRDPSLHGSPNDVRAKSPIPCPHMLSGGGWDSPRKYSEGKLMGNIRQSRSARAPAVWATADVLDFPMHISN